VVLAREQDVFGSGSVCHGRDAASPPMNERERARVFRCIVFFSCLAHRFDTLPSFPVRTTQGEGIGRLDHLIFRIPDPSLAQRERIFGRRRKFTSYHTLVHILFRDDGAFMIVSQDLTRGIPLVARSIRFLVLAATSTPHAPTQTKRLGRRLSVVFSSLTRPNR
jgi:hypothetical protein